MLTAVFLAVFWFTTLSVWVACVGAAEVWCVSLVAIAIIAAAAWLLVD